MALQGRKPGWLLDKILGRTDEALPPPVPPQAPAAPFPPSEDPAPVEPAPSELPILSPASRSEGQPDFMPAADVAAIPAVEPTVTEASPETPVAARPVDELVGATLQPVEGAPEGATLPGVPHPGLPETAAPASAPETRPTWFRRLADGMRRTSSVIGDSVTSLFTKRRLDRATLDDLEDVLVGADLGVETATRITAAVAGGRYDREISAGEVKRIMAAEIEKILAPVARPLVIESGRKPFVLLMVGVNGAGKTTTIGKLASKFRQQGLSVTIAAGDTFRAAAIEQLKVWGERVGAPVISRGQGADAAGLAFDALEEARGRGADVLMIDTAGRLQNKAGLMAELEKIIRVVRKLDPDAPHATLLVLDATVGQNALSQVEIFAKTAGVTGLVMTKLDGTARGGILVALAAKFGLPVHYIGVGEGVDDLEPFTAGDFARAIAGIEEAA
ncbi:signal recognition particle-docking protein FtsY [uncultured Enterovirga sp.]|uniref:signal recognition particle-docking protein FtsY n=1 Tax=uncultured Enterovirga sp. TaxID=2026352 RepID=UPI0035CBD0BA